MVISCHLWSSLIDQFLVTAQVTQFLWVRNSGRAQLGSRDLESLRQQPEVFEGQNTMGEGPKHRKRIFFTSCRLSKRLHVSLEFFQCSWTDFVATENFRSDYSSSPSGSCITFPHLPLLLPHTLSHKTVTNLPRFKGRGIRLHHLMGHWQVSRRKCGMKNIFVDNLQ